MASLFKRQNGFYYIVYRDGIRRVWLSTHTRVQEEANELYRSIKPSLESPKIVRLQELADELLKFAKLNYRKGTVDLFGISFEKFIKCVGNKPLRFVSPMDIEMFKEHLLQQIKKVSANVYLRTLKTAFNTAIRLKLIQNNPFMGCRLFRIPPQDPIYIPKEEIAKVLFAIHDRSFRDLVLFAAMTGMRRGELVSLRWTDIDLNARLIHIRNNDDFTVKGMRRRSIPINRDLFNLLLKKPRESEYVFVDLHGRPYRGASVTKKFKRTIRSCGLSERIRFHSLRHSFASWLVQSATPLSEVQKLLGHASVVTTQIYTHLEEQHLRGAAERIRIEEFTPKGLLS